MTENPKKVAIVCDWLIGGGAEKVVAQLHEIYPDAPIYTSFASDRWREELNNQVITGYLQKWPFSKMRKFIPFLRGWWFSHLDLTGFDLIISASGAEAKFVRTNNKERWWKRNMHLGAAQGANENRKGIVQDSTKTATRSLQHGDASKSTVGAVSFAGRQNSTVHISYIHAPTHYYWSRYEDYLKNPGFGALDWLARIGLKILVGPMRKWDYRSAQKPNLLLANSTHTKEQIKKYYGRDAMVVFPPITLKRFNDINKATSPGSYVCIGRFTPYKRIDLAIKACNQLGAPLTILGGGPDLHRLQKMSKDNVGFLINPTDGQIEEALSSAKAFIFPGLDDFGIAPVEALASGTPVIAYRAGGALDYVKDGVNGVFFEKQTTASLISAIKKLNAMQYTPNDIKQSVKRFSEKDFERGIESAIQKLLK